MFVYRISLIFKGMCHIAIENLRGFYSHHWVEMPRRQLSTFKVKKTVIENYYKDI